MPTFNPAVSTYIAEAEAFAQPILIELRAIVHSFCPEVTETIKWKFPVFTYKGTILCNMAAFKKHCSFGFWQEPLLDDPSGILARGKEGGMGSLGKLTTLADVPDPAQLGALILQAMALIDAGVKVPKAAPKNPKALHLPPAFVEALEQHPISKAAFDGFSYSHQREYVDWLNEAKKEETLLRRIDKAIEQLAEGKSKEWKYK